MLFEMLGKIETLVEAADELEKIADSITAWLDATRHLPVPPMMFMVDQRRPLPFRRMRHFVQADKDAGIGACGNDSQCRSKRLSSA